MSGGRHQLPHAVRSAEGAWASSSTSSRAADLERHGAGPEDERLDAERLPARRPAPRISSTVPTSRPARHSSRSTPSSTPRAVTVAQPLEAAREVGARPRRTARRARASATPSPDRGRPRRTRARAPSSRSRYASGVHAQHVFQPSACSATSRSSRSPLPPTNTARARLLHRRRAVHCARRRGGSRPSNVSGPPPRRPRHDVDRLARAGRAARPAAASPCRSPRTRARTNRRRARRRAGRR